MKSADSQNHLRIHDIASPLMMLRWSHLLRASPLVICCVVHHSKFFLCRGVWDRLSADYWHHHWMLILQRKGLCLWFQMMHPESVCLESQNTIITKNSFVETQSPCGGQRFGSQHPHRDTITCNSRSMGSETLLSPLHEWTSISIEKTRICGK